MSYRFRFFVPQFILIEMKITTLIGVSGLIAGGLLFASCSAGQKDKKDATDELRVVTKAESGQKAAVRMPLSDVTTRFQLQGKTCEARVFRTPDETLPIVENEQGDQFVDNRITVCVTCEGKRVLDRMFTKSSFASLLNARFAQYAILEGIVYDTVRNGKVCFAASVSYPESDLYVPIRLEVSANGSVVIEKSDLLDDYEDETGKE